MSEQPKATPSTLREVPYTMLSARDEHSHIYRIDGPPECHNGTCTWPIEGLAVEPENLPAGASSEAGDA